MKKLFTVLAVLLVASVAFAAVISGTVKAQYAFDFDKKTVTYGKPGVGSLDATLNFDPTDAIIIGDAEATHIEAKVVAGVDFQFNAGNNHADGYRLLQAKSEDESYNGDYVYFKAVYDAVAEKYTKAVGVKLAVKTFKIVSSNWEVSFIDTLGLDFAKSAIDSMRFYKNKAEDNTQYYSFDNSVKGAHNLKATFLGYSVGFGMGTAKNAAKGIENDWTDALKFAVTATTPSYTFGDFSFAVGAGYQVVDNDWAFAASAKAAYATDKVSVSGAYDAQVVNSNDAFVSNDLALNVAVAPVTVDVYFNNEGATVTDKYEKYFNRTTKDMPIVNSNYLSAKVTVDVAKVAENVPVTVTVGGYNLIGDETQILDAEVSTTIVPNFKFGVYFNDWCDFVTGRYADGGEGDHRKLGGTVEFTGVQNLTLSAELAYAFAKEDGNKELYAEVGAAYAHELFDAEATIAVDKVYDQDALFGGNLEASSTKLVDGAKLYAKLQFDLNKVINDDKTNEFVVGCKVSF